MPNSKTHEETPLQSPIPFSHGSNGEYVPREHDPRIEQAERRFAEIAERTTQRLQISRRKFLASASSTTAALCVLNSVFGCGSPDGSGGNGYDVNPESIEDNDLACDLLQHDTFVFDVQTHHVNPAGPWRDNGRWEAFLNFMPQGACGELDRVDCYNTSHYIREMFLNSDTTMAVLSALPADLGENPLEIEDAFATRAIVEELSSTERVLLHGLVQPNLGIRELVGMHALADDYDVKAWKVYTPYGGWRLDDPNIGLPFLDRARLIGIPIICAHKGLPLNGFNPDFASPDDIGPAASLYPDLTFVVYHSGYETDTLEGPYDPDAPNQGVDRLIKSVEDSGLGPGSNVYAELGSTWRNLMTRPDEAAHVLGKLLKHLGPERVVWGTDSIWYGSPQDQIDAFLQFQISPEFQERFGYPELTMDIKRGILGLNAAEIYDVDPTAQRCAIDGDEIASMKRAMDPLERRTFRQTGPQTRREFLNFLRLRDGMPG